MRGSRNMKSQAQIAINHKIKICLLKITEMNENETE